jgi:hypothetical protein
VEPAIWAIIGVGLLIWVVAGSFERARDEPVPAIFLAQSNGRHAANYRRLYGSHIAAVKGLQRSGGWATDDNLRTFFGRVARNWRGANGDGSYDSWLEALTASGYVELVANGDAQLVMITPFGVDFVRWMQTSHVPQLKPG